ncbi:LmeA family phospholipid-binding protein [Nocardia nova]|uniref:DUF2993 domain-containing protein n=1 Tax=Nocardia nova SH22a TaxID=1415166 RepID=W5TRD6_9NOCA|nr:DUF2993 domain-containing protein [Nocardia nova]AHH21832.1 hypothetical protein NONO_c70710 [Nocardia nova SH22a]
MSSNPADTAAAPTPAPADAPRRHRGRKIALIVGLVVLLALVGTAAGAETYMRHKSKQCIASQMEKELGSKVDVGFGPKPLLLTAVDHKVQYITVDSDDTKFGPAVDMKVHARVNDVKMIDGGRGGSTIGSSSADATWSNDGIAQTLTGLVSGVESDPASGTLDVKVLGGLADLKVQPHIVNGKIEVTTQSASLLGLGLPTDLVDNIVQSMTQSLQTYPMGMQPTSVKVTDNGISVSLRGGPATLQAGNGPDSQDIRC